MKILIIGSEGSMGKRYTAIFKYFFPEIQIEKTDAILNPIICWEYFEKGSKAIVCTPTDTHFEICKQLIEHKIDFICEKPISKNPEEIKELIALAKENGVNGYMCNNWQYASNLFYVIGNVNIFYNYYNTGKDGVAWDCIQIIYLAKQFIINSVYPVFSAMMDVENIDTEKIQWSYVKMIRNWVEGLGNQLWTLEDGLKATEKVIEYIKQKETK